MERKILVPEAFWDVEEKELDLQRDREFIIARVLEHGTLEAVREVIRFYDRETIREVVKRSNLLSKKTGVFWASILQIPRKDVNACSTLPRYLRKQHKPFEG